jgi:hypothetical protein
MSGALARLTEAVSVFADETRVVELAVRALHETCPRGAAFAITSRGPRADRLGTFRMMQGGAWLDLAIPHLAYVRTPAFDVTNVPLVQRNRWVEPFALGIATPEGFKKSTIYPLVAHLGLRRGVDRTARAHHRSPARAPRPPRKGPHQRRDGGGSDHRGTDGEDDAGTALPERRCVEPGCAARLVSHPAMTARPPS